MSPPGKTQPQTKISHVDVHHAAARATSHSLKRVKSPIKSTSTATQKHNLHVQAKVGGASGKKQAAAQKVTMDTSQKVKFAIVNSQNTSMQMNLSQRQKQPGRMTGKEATSLASDRKSHGKPNLKSPRSRQHVDVRVPSSEGTQSRPFSRPTGTDSHLSASSYQRYIMSQTTDHRNNDIDTYTCSNLTTKTANTPPAPIIIEHGVSVSVSGVESSFQPSKIDFCESFQGDDDGTSEGSEILSQSVSQLDERETDTGSYSTRSDTCSSSYSYSMTGDQMDSPLLGREMASTKPQSGRVTIEVDMRFSSSIDRPSSELSQLSLSSAAAGGSGHEAGMGDGLSMSGAVSEQSHAASGRGSQEDEHDSQPDGGSVSKRSSISHQSDVDSQPSLSVQSSRSDSMVRENLMSSPKRESFSKKSKNLASLEHLDDRPTSAIIINTADKSDDTFMSDRRLSDISTTQQQALDVMQDHMSKSSTTLHDDSQSSIDRDSSKPYSHSLSSVGIPPSYSPLPASQDATVTFSISANSQHHEYHSLPPPSQSVTTAASSPTRSQRSSFGSVQSSHQQQYHSLSPPLSQQSVTTATTSQTRSQRLSFGSVPSQSVTTASSQMQSQRTSFGSVQSSVPSIKPSASHLMFEGLRHLSTSGSHADTSSWLLAHHSGSKIRSDFPTSEERGRDAVDLVEQEDSYDTGSIKDVKSEIEVNDSSSLLDENLQCESQLQLQSFDSKESSNICLSSTNTDGGTQDTSDKTDRQETQADALEDKDGGVSVPAVQLPVEPPEIKVIVSSESQESAPTEKAFSMADIIETQMHLHVEEDGDTVDTADSGKSREKGDSTPAKLAVSMHVHVLAC